MSKQTAAFALRVLEAAVKAHQMHWASRSYAQHMALGEFYEALPGLIDSVIESYQGKYGLIPAPKEDPVTFLQDLSSFIATERDFCEDSEIQNEIDAIATAIDGAMYKLKFLS